MTHVETKPGDPQLGIHRLITKKSWRLYLSCLFLHR